MEENSSNLSSYRIENKNVLKNNQAKGERKILVNFE